MIARLGFPITASLRRGARGATGAAQITMFTGFRFAVRRRRRGAARRTPRPGQKAPLAWPRLAILALVLNVIVEVLLHIRHVNEDRLVYSPGKLVGLTWW